MQTFVYEEVSESEGGRGKERTRESVRKGEIEKGGINRG